MELAVLGVAIVPTGLIFLSGKAPWFNEMVLAVMGVIYVLLRLYLTSKRYNKPLAFRRLQHNEGTGRAGSNGSQDEESQRQQDSECTAEYEVMLQQVAVPPAPI